MRCVTCGVDADPDDAFCGVCGTAMPNASCMIKLRPCQHPKFYGDEWEFVAVTNDGDIVSQSEPFSANADVLDAEWPPLAHTGAWKAFDHLQQRLIADGWAFIDTGTPWHRGWFAWRRHQTAPTPLLAPTPAPSSSAPTTRPPRPAASARSVVNPPPAVAERDVRRGSGYLLVGLIVTGGTLLLASAAGGGAVLVLWGALVVGAFYLIRGLIRSRHD
jgi:hypothetical protein